MATMELTVEDAVRAYLGDVMAGFELPRLRPVEAIDDHEACAAQIFDVLTSREFCYLGRTKAAAYRDVTIELLVRRIATGGPLRLFYDIGPGYHATLRPGELPLSFDVGLSELLILSQVTHMCRRVSELYSPGVRFWLVIDNLCGLRTNDISTDLTDGYCARLRALIDQLGVTDCVELIVESEEFALDEYDRLLNEIEPGVGLPEPTEAEVENVERFLGRRCSVVEAAERIDRYRRAGSVTDFLIDRLVRGVHMTQRATGATLGFRPFPGGDSRTQCGEVAFAHNHKGKLRPFLLTSRNVDDFECVRLTFPELLPSGVTSVAYASERDRRVD